MNIEQLGKMPNIISRKGCMAWTLDYTNQPLAPFLICLLGSVGQKLRMPQFLTARYNS